MVALLAAVAAGAVAVPASKNATVVTRAPSAAAAVGSSRKTRSCDPTLVLCVETNVGYSPSFQEPRFYSAGVRRPAYPVVAGAPLLPSVRLAPPVVPVVHPPVVPVVPPPVVRVVPPPVVPIIRRPVLPVIPPPAIGVVQPAVRILPQPAVSVIRRPYPVVSQPYPVVSRPYPVVSRPYPTDTRLFPTYPAT